MDTFQKLRSETAFRAVQALYRADGEKTRQGKARWIMQARQLAGQARREAGCSS